MRTRRSRSSGNPASPLDEARGKPQGHTPVLLHETLEALAIRADDIVVDATVGGAGHALAMCEMLGTSGIFIGFDMDADAIARGRDRLVGVKPQVHLLQQNFRTLDPALETLHVPHITKALFDLGWSSYQLDSGRGFSFQTDEPLQMTYAKEGSVLTASTIVNEWAESSLADVIYGFGEERFARRIAKRIVEERQRRQIRTAKELADIVIEAVPARARFGRTHPATKTFQAIRIATNDELGSLDEGLRAAWQHLKVGGRIAVISFHSIEDRVVKRMFAEWEAKEGAVRITRRPITAGEQEIQVNRRARSAKLRVVEKVNDFSNYGQKNIQD
jgi:16S rRNA (cytosine1402-N4)-methyltransferase